MALSKETFAQESVVQVMRPDIQPNGTIIVRAGTDAEAGVAVANGLPFTKETAYGLQLNENGTVTAVARNEEELAAAVLSGRPYSLPERKKLAFLNRILSLRTKCSNLN